MIAGSVPIRIVMYGLLMTPVLLTVLVPLVASRVMPPLAVRSPPKAIVPLLEVRFTVPLPEPPTLIAVDVVMLVEVVTDREEMADGAVPTVNTAAPCVKVNCPPDVPMDTALPN